MLSDPSFGSGPNIWIGTSVEDSAVLDRIDELRAIPGFIRFISFEPLIGAVGAVNLTEIDWAIVGGESGPRARPIQLDWVHQIEDRCRAYGTAFFFKQWGGKTPKSGGRDLDGREWNEFPSVLRAV
jgi:protein gp37